MLKQYINVESSVSLRGSIHSCLINFTIPLSDEITVDDVSITSVLVENINRGVIDLVEHDYLTNKNMMQHLANDAILHIKFESQAN